MTTIELLTDEEIDAKMDVADSFAVKFAEITEGEELPTAMYAAALFVAFMIDEAGVDKDEMIEVFIEMVKEEIDSHPDDGEQFSVSHKQH